MWGILWKRWDKVATVVSDFQLDRKILKDLASNLRSLLSFVLRSVQNNLWCRESGSRADEGSLLAGTLKDELLPSTLHAQPKIFPKHAVFSQAGVIDFCPLKIVCNHGSSACIHAQPLPFGASSDSGVHLTCAACSLFDGVNGEVMQDQRDLGIGSRFSRMPFLTMGNSEVLCRNRFGNAKTNGSLSSRMACLKDIAPAAENNINTQFIVLDKGRTILEGRNKTCLALVADETASVHFQFWGDECDAFEPGDIIRLANGIFSYSRNTNLVLRAGRRGAIEKVGEFTMVFVETPNMSEITWIPDTNRSNKYVQDSVISSHSRIFPPLP
ncbi:hypothetical protein SADUNF_Sadunf02G0207000 [Salix dunnii]|uniref:Uncharacterized protein n=1 Tax=Salix dunnii TaxID=1413687 RepID=A0A835N9F8_9ROSI|nr:hypothetical protein SADUNF_Sadunf02G0207000 [Salix dunnii]